MSGKRQITTQSVWDMGAVLAAFETAGIKINHAYRMWGYLVRHPSATWHDVPDFPRAAVELLDSKFAKFTTKVVKCQTSADGGTTKLLIQLQDGMEVESVVMTYDTSERYQNLDADDEPACSSNSSTISAPVKGQVRHTLCVSSQVGCQMGCTFCATGTMGLKGNLTAGEIVEQLVHAKAVKDIRNIVFMGMGEPLNNYDAVKAAVSMMTDSKYFGLRRRHVSISTVGVIPRIKQLSEDLPGVSLAWSLHAPTQELRLKIVPSARAYKLDKLMDAIVTYQQTSGQKVFVEYVVLAGVNDQEEVAHQLGQLLQGKNMLLNLIPWNPVYSPDGPVFEAPDPEAVAKFQSIVREQYGVFTTVRQEKGQDISGACGQLVIEQGSKNSCSTPAKSCGGNDNTGTGAGVRDIEELAQKP